VELTKGCLNMNRKPAFRVISLFLLMIFITACSNADASPTAAVSLPTSAQESENTEVPAVTDAPVSSEGGMPVAGAGLCANAYYPVREGSTWTYQSTGGPVGGYGFTDTITSVRDDGFTLTSQFDELTRTQEWGCKPEGLVALQLGGTSAATLNSQDMQLNLDVNNVSGVTFPSAIAPGDEWQHNLEFTGKMMIADQEAEATGNAQSSFTAIGIETVTVPAGTFEAMKIRIDTTLNINATFQGVSVPVTVTGPYDYWFVQGVGWVKASGTGNVGGESFTETIELQAYNIP
jgi:hypothetical protein